MSSSAAMWWAPDRIASDLRSPDSAVRRATLTLLRSHRESLDAFAALHPAFFFDALRQIVLRNNESDDVKRKVWDVLAAVALLHSKTHTARMLHEFHLLTLALQTLREAFEQRRGIAYVNQVLGFLSALKTDNAEMFAIDPTVVSCLTELPVRLGRRDIDRFGIDLIVQLLRRLQATEGAACAEVVDGCTADMLDRAERAVVLIFAEKTVEECRSIYASCSTQLNTVIPHELPNWSELSSISIDALLLATIDVLLQVVSQDAGRISSFDTVVALKWLQTNTAVLTPSFLNSCNLSDTLFKISSNADSSDTLRQLAQELWTTVASQAYSSTATSSPMPPCSTTDSPRGAPDDSDTHFSLQITPEVYRVLQGLEFGSSDEKLSAIASWKSHEWGENETRAAISVAIRVLGKREVSDIMKKQIWSMLAAAVRRCRPKGSSITCEREYYDLVFFALDTAVGAKQESKEIVAQLNELLIGPLAKIWLDELARNGTLWSHKNPDADSAIVNMITLQLDRTDLADPSGNVERTLAWTALDRHLESAKVETAEQLACRFPRVISLLARAFDPTRHIDIAALSFGLSLARRQLLHLKGLNDLAKAILASILPSSQSLALNPTTAVEYLNEIALVHRDCQAVIDASVPNLAKIATNYGRTSLQLVTSLLLSYNTRNATVLPTPEFIRLFSSGNELEQFVILKSMESAPASSIRKFVESEDILAVLHNLSRNERHSSLVKQILSKLEKSKHGARTNNANPELQTTNPAELLSHDHLNYLNGRVPTELFAIVQELETTSTEAERQVARNRRIPEVFALIKNEASTPADFLVSMKWLMCPTMFERLWQGGGSVPASEVESLVMMMLRVLEIDGRFAYRNGLLRFLRSLWMRFHPDDATLEPAIPLLIQRLNEESDHDTANLLVDLVRELGTVRRGTWSAIDAAVQTVVNEANGGDTFYNNLLAVYRKHEGMQLGLTRRNEVPNVETVVDILSNGHDLERFIALKLLNKHIPMLQPATSPPSVLFESIRLIFGLSIVGPAQNRALASGVLSCLSAKNTNCAEVVSQLFFLPNVAEAGGSGNANKDNTELNNDDSELEYSDDETGAMSDGDGEKGCVDQDPECFAQL